MCRRVGIPHANRSVVASEICPLENKEQQVIFYKRGTDQDKVDCTELLLNSCLSTLDPSVCFILGAGPSLSSASPLAGLYASVERSPSAKFSVNYGGRGRDGEGWLIKPTHWTTYDQTYQFPKSLLFDPSITKFIKGNRAMDLATDTTEKVCDCPNVICFDNQTRRYKQHWSTGSTGVLDSRDSMLQAIDIAIKLGYRTLVCLGCEMRVPISEELQEFLIDNDITTSNFFQVPSEITKKTGKSTKAVHADLDEMDLGQQYCMNERKPSYRMAQSDKHYWETVQRLRLSKKSLASHGVRILSATPVSRLNTWFEFVDLREFLMTSFKGLNPEEETTVGVYARDNGPPSLPFHTDLPAYTSPVKEKIPEEIKLREPVKQIIKNGQVQENKTVNRIEEWCKVAPVLQIND